MIFHCHVSVWGGLPTVIDMVFHDFSESTKVVLLLMAGLKIIEEVSLFSGPGLEP